ncbi:hypothetical protein [Gallaecimonas mangrovi]|uniref:hypothetical protein n=1 Tax=Gallaecimonas mangrovi TaxID=2291597 RepID=UPI000E20016D|nr:hypothetical protein [Gallaecimonas mangrovi]
MNWQEKAAAWAITLVAFGLFVYITSFIDDFILSIKMAAAFKWLALALTLAISLPFAIRLYRARHSIKQKGSEPWGLALLLTLAAIGCYFLLLCAVLTLLCYPLHLAFGHASHQQFCAVSSSHGGPKDICGSSLTLENANFYGSFCHVDSTLRHQAAGHLLNITGTRSLFGFSGSHIEVTATYCAQD